jgi:hypothetical protein
MSSKTTARLQSQLRRIARSALGLALFLAREVALDEKTGIGSIYDDFFRGHGPEIRLVCPEFRPNSTYKPTYTRSSFA